MDKIKNKMGQLDLDKFHQKDSNTSQLKRLIKMCHQLSDINDLFYHLKDRSAPARIIQRSYIDA